VTGRDLSGEALDAGGGSIQRGGRFLLEGFGFTRLRRGS
jgi:hypothetical protein